MQQQAITELNNVLKGNYMAIDSYDRYIEHVQDPNIKTVLQQIQQDHKESAARISERIQNLGGDPVNGVGIIGTISETFQTLTGTPEDTARLIQDACNGESMGIQKTEQIAAQLDPTSRALVTEILERDRKHVNLLSSLIH